MKKPFLLLPALALLLNACASAASPAQVVPSPAPATATLAPTAAPADPFDYDASKPFDTKVLKTLDRDGVIIEDIVYKAHNEAFAKSLAGRTSAYLVKPQGKGPFGGVVFFHKAGGHHIGSREEFVEEAIVLAKNGIVSLLIQGQLPSVTQFRSDKSDLVGATKQVIEMRRALDFLEAMPEVDPDKLAVVGHDYGGVYAGVLSGVDKRPQTFIIIAAPPSFGGFFTSNAQKAADIDQLMEPLAPTGYVSRNLGSSFLFQFGEKDTMVSAELARQYYDAAEGEKDIRFYSDASHDMISMDAQKDRLTWLMEKLGLIIASR